MSIAINYFPYNLNRANYSKNFDEYKTDNF